MHRVIPADRDLYAVLNIKFTPDLNKIKAAYRRAALLAHPDKGGTSEAFNAIRTAFEVLSCSKTRHLYNKLYIHSLDQRRRRLPARPFASRCNSSQLLRRSVVPLKRSSSSLATTAEPEAKHHCGSSSHTSKIAVKQQLKKCPRRVVPIGNILGLMRELLQGMAAVQRSAAIQGLSSSVQVALLRFMSRSPNPETLDSGISEIAKRCQVYKQQTRKAALAGNTGVRVLQTAGSARYRAHLVIKGLRLYTNTSDYEKAIEHHFVFVQMRELVAAECATNPDLFTDPEKLLGLLEGVLADCGFSEAALDLHVLVYMRGTPWLDKDTYIVSPVMRLAKVVPLYAGLLRAQSASWQDLRAQWVDLIRLKSDSRAKGLSQVDAEMMIDQARHRALSARLKQAEKRLKQAFKRAELDTKRAHAIAARQQRRLEADKQHAIALKQKTARKRLRMWQKRQQIKGRDMTMEDIMSTYQPHT